MPHMNSSIPQHIYGFVDRQILYGLDKATTGFEPCVIFGVTSIPSRALHFSILCESGAQWARIPLHMLRHTSGLKNASDATEEGKNGYPITHDLSDLQIWDAHGWDFSVVQYEYLREMGCRFRNRAGEWIPASYWFTLDHTDNGYSQYPPEHKCYHLLLLEDGSGQIAAMPNNRILWHDDSWVKPGHPLDYRVMASETWHAEQGRNGDLTSMLRD